MVKVCICCQVEQDINNFYKHPQMADGHLGKCKDCCKKQATKRRWENIDSVREYDRNRPNKVKRNEENKDRWLKHMTENPSFYRNKKNEYVKRWRGKNPLKAKVHSMVSEAIKKGDIIKPVVCQICGKENTRIEGHHKDYSKPYDIMWLCSQCHRVEHKI